MQLIQRFVAYAAAFEEFFTSDDGTLLEDPTESGDKVWIRWRAVYRLQDTPALVVDGEESATFRDERIYRLECRIDDETRQRVAAWLQEYSGQLPALREQ